MSTSTVVADLGSGASNSGLSNITTISNPPSTNNNLEQASREFPSQAVLQRMKEMEILVQDLKSKLQDKEDETQKKNALIKKLETDNEELSTERKKEMEELYQTGINEWLNTLQISEDIKEQFRKGIVGITKQADIKNPAWEVLCNASKAHKENVAKINELVTLCNEKEKTIESLLQSSNDPTFHSNSSRMQHSGSASSTAAIPTPGNKRPRMEEHSMDRGVTSAASSGHADGNNSEGGNDAWDHFAKMIYEGARQTYY